jgi:hypothetical protein
MKAGFAEKDITPPPGTQRAGAYSILKLEEAHDPLKVRAALFEHGAERVLLLGLDVCMVSRKTVETARARINRETGIPPQNILIAASHTHSGGSLWGFRPEELADAPEIIKKLALERSPSVDVAFEDLALSGMAAAAVTASKNMRAEKFSFGKGMDGAAVFNRRFKMRDGGAVTHPGKGNPDILEPAGPADPEVAVIGAWDENGKLAGCIVNYACHGTCMCSMRCSADWIFRMEETIRGKFGRDVVVVFLNGASGDVTQVDNVSLRENHSGPEWADIVGTRVGAEALKVLVSSDKAKVSTLRCLSETIKIKRRVPCPQKTAKAIALSEKLADTPNNSDNMDFIWAKERVLADFIERKEPFATIELQAVQIGPVVILSNPAEFFCSPGLEIKKNSKFPVTMIAELANGGAGYVPDAKAFSASGGGYETRLTSYSNLDIHAGDIIVKASSELASRLAPEPMPAGPQIESPGAVWRYGNTPPELD